MTEESIKPAPSAFFTPDSLKKLATLFDDVWRKLVRDKVVKPGAGSESRALLAKRVFGLARSGWSESQIKQLLE
jgi:hypothetical protein